MKRSEVKTIIWEAGNHLSREYPDELFELITEDILLALEKAGMKPPCNSDFGGHKHLNEFNECDDYVESCNFRFEDE